MKKTLLSLALLANLSYAAPEGTTVTAGPLTALDKLSSFNSVKSAPIPKRNIAIENWQTQNGAKVLFVAAQELPMVDVRLLFDAGSARDGDKFGLASLVSRMLDEGTPTRNTDQIAASFENIGATFSSAAYRDMFIVDLRVLSDPQYLEPALDVYSDIIANPIFPDAAFKRIFDGAQVGQQQKLQSPSAQASILFYQHLYGSHPYAHPSNGTPDSLKKITTNDLKQFHQQYFVANNATIAIVGALSREQAQQVAEKISRGLNAGQAAAKLNTVTPLAKAVHKHLSFPSQQTHIMMGQASIQRGNPDYEALYVGNEILGGGGFNSLLMNELREKRGLTYGVYSSIVPMHVQGPFIVSLSTRSDQTQQALDLLRTNLRQFIRDGVSDSQLQEAKDNILGSFPLSTSSNSSILAYLGSIGFYNLPLDYLDSFNERINRVTSSQIKAAFRKHIHPDKMLTVTVGQGITVANP
ncbi:M16 family metallopeptidase [Agitococcus lubricus]|uniref:Zinc protease n=1 Tax=Agitococcus lubricus TaxID=1077255 RepID=A0A2T5IZL7_9GAMM|nr:pitrilysin family protein [Agitococcus lubricus]PTQ89406.1 zinc protease [Agitococcus lubricus]